MNKKYELTSDTNVVFGRKLRRIKALVSFGSFEKGKLGGYVEKEENLSQYDNAYVEGNACVVGNARVEGNAYVGGNACVVGNANIGKDAYITKTIDYLTVGPIGSRNDTTTFYRTKTGVNVICGCFCGTLDEFEEAIKQTHGGTFYEKEYNAAIELVKVHFRLEESDERSEVEEQI